MIDGLTDKKNVSPLDFAYDSYIDVPITSFGKITEKEIVFPGPFITISQKNIDLWKSVLSDVYSILEKVRPPTS